MILYLWYNLPYPEKLILKAFTDKPSVFLGIENKGGLSVNAFLLGLNKMIELTQERLKETLHYEPLTGYFTWIKPKQVRRINGIAGCVDKNGYRLIGINGKLYYAHRLVYLYIKGEFPPEQVDHINHSKDDNRFSNLRLVSNQENHRNQSMRVDNKSGFVGVSFAKNANKWVAYIKINGKPKHLGLFTELAEAIAARKDANTKYGFHQNHGAI